MPGVIGNAGEGLDHLGYARKRPQLGLITVRPSSAQQGSFDSLEARRFKLRAPSSTSRLAKCRGPTAGKVRVPATDALA
jgi:hypothetical protein